MMGKEYKTHFSSGVKVFFHGIAINIKTILLFIIHLNCLK